MILRARADRLELSSEETGWTLLVETDEGDTLVLNIHGVAFQFAGSRQFWDLVDWREEGLEARAFVCHVDESGGVRGDA